LKEFHDAGGIDEAAEKRKSHRDSITEVSIGSAMEALRDLSVEGEVVVKAGTVGWIVSMQAGCYQVHVTFVGYECPLIVRIPETYKLTKWARVKVPGDTGYRNEAGFFVRDNTSRPDVIKGNSDEQDVLMWIQCLINECPGPQSLMQWLKDGTILCRIVNVIRPGSTPKIHHSHKTFHQLANVSNFLKACRDLGVPSKFLFSSVDLMECKNPKAVIICIHHLGSVVRLTAPEFKGPYLGMSTKVYENQKPEQTKPKVPVPKHKPINPGVNPKGTFGR
jgi:hypothetical protein